MTGAINWKSRYADLLAQQDKQQARYQRKAALLLAVLDQVIVLARLADGAAESKLDSLHATIGREKVKNVDLENAVLSLTGHVDSSLKTHQKKLALVRVSLQSLARQTRTLTRHPQRVNDLKQLEKNLGIRHRSMLDFADQLVCLSSLQSRVIQESERQVSLLGRLFKSQSVAQAPPAPVREVGKALAVLLKKLDPPQAVSDTCEVLCSRLHEGFDSLEQVPEMMDGVCQIIETTVNHDRSEFEAFLAQMNHRLQDASVGLGRTTVLVAKGVEAELLRDSQLREQVGGLRTTVSEASNIDALKLQISVNIDEMTRIMDAHAEMSEKRRLSLADELDALVERSRFLEKAGREAEAELQRERRRASTDALTSLPNRLAYEARAAQELTRWQRYSRPLSLAVIDIDLFKVVNDSHGHAIGDKVLEAVASRIRERLRNSDFVARYGGEEFVVLLPETDAEQAHKVLESVRLAIAETPIVIEEISLAVTLSIGIASFAGQDIVESVFTRADRALYLAKDAGRNQCVVSGDEVRSD